MATKNATMALSVNQAKAIAKAEGVRFPRKINGWVMIGNVRLTHLPTNFRKKERNAPSFRLTTKNHNELTPFYGVANEHGRSACISFIESDES